MSEYQNRAVELMQTLIGNQSTADINDRRNAFIFRAIGLYQALGGDPESVQGVVEKVYAVRAPRIDAAVGDLMYNLAGVGHASDRDIIQAAYNKLDQAVPSAVPLKRART